MGEPLTEGWLAEAGFKWSQQERQPQKHWTLWLGWGSTEGGKFSTIEDLGVEVSMAWWPGRNGNVVGDPNAWNCWLKGMNSSFLHVRYIRTRDELTGLIAALTGRPWDQSLSRYGNLYTPDMIASFDAQHQGESHER